MLAATGDEEGFGAAYAAYTIFQIGVGGVVPGLKLGPDRFGPFQVAD
jgi:hypothetical protein